VLFRAAYGTGFREASLPELYNAQSAATTATFLDPVTGFKWPVSAADRRQPRLEAGKIRAVVGRHGARSDTWFVV